MSFLAPIAGVLGAALCVPALIVMYLLKLRRMPRRVGSTMLWSAAVRDLQANVPFKWIRPTWLLFLQLAITALLLLALARPALDSGNAAPDRLVIILDRSASMSAADMGDADAPRTRFEAARARARTLLDSLSRGRGVQLAVIDASARPRLRAALDSNLAAARDAIDALAPTDQPADLAAALQLADAVLAGADAGDESTTPTSGIIVISDGNLDDADLRAQTPVSLELVRPRMHAPNAGITALAARRDLDDPSIVRVFVRALATADAPRSIPLIVRHDARVVGGVTITFPDAPVAEAAATVELRAAGGGVIETRLGVEDALASDDAAALVLRQPSAPRITLVSADPDSAWAIMDVLAELSPRAPVRIHESEYDPSAIASLADLVVFDRVQPASPPPIPSISLGAGWPAPAITRLDGPPDLPVAWNRAHPIMRGVGLDAVVLDPGARLEWGNDYPEIVELARGKQGPLLAFIDHPVAPRVVAALDQANSNWWLSVGFPIFMANALDVLTRRDQLGDASMSTTRDELAVRVGNDRLAVLRGPVELTAEAAPGELVARLGVPERAGIYQGAEPEPFVAVNLLDARESSLLGVDALRIGGDRAALGAGVAGPREIWHWFVLAAAALLAIEWILSAALFRA